MKKEVQKVEVYVKISGSYCAFNECNIGVIYDITNSIDLGAYNYVEGDEDPLEYIKNFSGDDYFDFAKKRALLVGGRYYILF